jgi:hypothetical protein
MAASAQRVSAAAADAHEPDARLPVNVGARRDAGVQRLPAATLPDPRAQATQRNVQAGQITAAPTALPGSLPGDRLARHVPGQAVPQARVANELANGVRTTHPALLR